MGRKTRSSDSDSPGESKSSSSGSGKRRRLYLEQEGEEDGREDMGDESERTRGEGQDGQDGQDGREGGVGGDRDASLDLFAEEERAPEEAEGARDSREGGGEAMEEDEVGDDSWRGDPFSALSVHISAAVAPLVGRADSHIFVEWPPGDVKKVSDRWDGDHVRMPCSEQSLFPLEKRTVNRWSRIKECLNGRVTSVDDLGGRVLGYNVRKWNFEGLNKLVANMEEEEQDAFFDRVLPGIISACLALPDRVRSPIPLLSRILERDFDRWGRSSDACRRLTFSQSQLASLLANAFLCTFPRRNSGLRRNSEYANYPDINFNRLFARGDRSQEEKLKCMLNYFRRIARRDFGAEQETLVTFERRCVSARHLPDWARSPRRAVPERVHVDAAGCIEDHGFLMLQVDFANAFIGGGVLGHGCVQEEIRFAICPELIAARLFTEKLHDNECLVVTGVERFSNYSGYASSFEFTGSHEDETPVDTDCLHRITKIVAIDAICFRDPKSQYEEGRLRRELNKAYVGFYNKMDPPEGNEKPASVATGNWGCGAFGGDPCLKSLVQMMAAAECDRDLCYFTFGDKVFRDRFANLALNLKEKSVTVGQMFGILSSYRNAIKEKRDLFDYVLDRVCHECETDDDEELLVRAAQVAEIDQACARKASTFDDGCDKEEESVRENGEAGSEEMLKITLTMKKDPETDVSKEERIVAPVQQQQEELKGETEDMDKDVFPAQRDGQSQITDFFAPRARKSSR